MVWIMNFITDRIMTMLTSAVPVHSIEFGIRNATANRNRNGVNKKRRAYMTLGFCFFVTDDTNLSRK